jgi:FkbM family methyltransferase
MKMSAATIIAVLFVGVLATAAANPKAGAECKLLIDGKPFVNRNANLSTAWALHNHLKEEHIQTVHTLQPTDVPCGGFLRKGSYYVRSRSTDTLVMLDIMFRHEFQFLKKFFANQPPKRILDLGANAGYATAYFASLFPLAQVASVEASNKNQPMVVLNTKFTDRVTIFPGGIWHRPAFLYIEGRHSGAEWGFVVTELNDTSLTTVQAKDVIPAFTVDHIMKTMNWDSIDFMKVDIECTEMLIFGGEAPPPWLTNVTCVSMEIHPASFCGYTNRDKIFSNFATAGFSHEGYYGELEVWCKKGFTQ